MMDLLLSQQQTILVSTITWLVPAQAPVSKIGREEDEERRIFHVGYHQDTTDNPDTSNPKAGHYQSLEKISGRLVECCGIASPPPSNATPTSPPLITITTVSFLIRQKGHWQVK